MVRRRKTHSGEKETGGSSKPKVSRKDATLERWERREDIPLDDEERFHADKDKILLEGANSDEDDDDLGDRNEVFALKGLQESSDEADGVDEDEDEEEEDRYAFDDGYDEEYKASISKVSQSKASRELTRLRAEDKEDDEALDEDLDTWGTKQSEYYTGGFTQDDEYEGSLDSEDERKEREEMEQEVRRLQKKTREEISEEDYGLGDENELGVDEDSDFLKELDKVDEQPVEKKDKKTLLKELELKSPETLALAREWEDIASDVVRVEEALESRDPTDPAMGLMSIHYQTLLTYATLVAFYFHLRSLPQYVSRPDALRTHPIMGRLLSLKTALAELEGLGFSAVSDDLGSENSDQEDDVELEDAERVTGGLWGRGKNGLGRMDRGELEALLRDANGDLTDSESGEDDEGSEMELDIPKPKKHGKKSKPTPDPGPSFQFDLIEPTFESHRTNGKKKKTANPTSTSEDLDFGYGDPLSIPASDLSDKMQRKRDLQYHTQKIVRKSKKREKARMGRVGGGGDDDLPYEGFEPVAAVKKGGRNARDLAAEGWGGAEDTSAIDANNVELGVKKRAWGETNVAGLEGGVESGANKKKRPREPQDDANNAAEDGTPTTEYLELVKSLKKRKKDDKKAVWEAAEQDKRDTVLASEGGSGPRSLTKSILKNRGLTRQRRRKDLANPRLKKAMQYEKAKKKLATVKATYKGGLSATGGVYEGEKTGISSHLIRGVKFG